MKDPAFLFYSSDFLTGVQDLTMEERGQYITLLSIQHQKGHMSDKLIKISIGNAAADVMAKFRQDTAGLWYNERLDIESEKRRSHSDKQKQRALDGWKKRKESISGITTANATALPLEDINRNEDDITIKDQPKILGTGKHYIVVKKKYMSDYGYRIQGVDGLNEYYQIHKSSINFPEWSEKFMRDKNSKPFNDFDHVWNTFDMYVKQQFK